MKDFESLNSNWESRVLLGRLVWLLMVEDYLTLNCFLKEKKEVNRSKPSRCAPLLNFVLLE
jgi:hypothetical protein